MFWRTKIKQLKINQEITSNEVLLIDEEGKSLGRVSRDQALFLAYDKGLDLALLNENVNPPIAKFLDYGKYLYNQEKQAAKQKAHTHTQEVKEIRLGIKISEHDLEVKMNQAIKFLDRGDKVRVVIQLKGREMMFRDKVNGLMEEFKTKIGAIYEKPIERMGSKFIAHLAKINKGQDETKNS